MNNRRNDGDDDTIYVLSVHQFLHYVVEFHRILAPISIAHSPVEMVDGDGVDDGVHVDADAHDDVDE